MGCAQKDVVMSRSESGIFKVGHVSLLLEVAVDYLDQLLGAAAVRVARFRVDEMRSDVVFENHRKQSVHRTTAASDELQHVHATALFFKCALNGFDLSLDATNPVEQLLFFANRMAHG